MDAPVVPGAGAGDVAFQAGAFEPSTSVLLAALGRNPSSLPMYQSTPNARMTTIVI